jgi:hypothetical protein
MAIQTLVQNVTGVSNRYQLQQGNVVRMPSTCPGIRVLSGCAWITRNGEDTLLTSGEKIQFSRGVDFALISPNLTQSLTFEVLDTSDQ